MSITELFGDTKELLRQASGGAEEVGLNVLVKESEQLVVGLYFSAHWCPPCRAFTPQLVKWYKNFKETSSNKDDLEMIFVSSDRDEGAFNDYYKEMPWLALPYSCRDMKAKLSSLFKVSGIPTLVFLDGKTGKVITKEGRGIVTDDAEGKDFPWRPKKAIDILPGPLVSKDKEINWSDVTEDVIGLYFSAHWCGPCRVFTPQLVHTYEEVRKNNGSFQIIFASSDRDEDSFKEYLDTMPWLALPYDDIRKKNLSRVFDVSGIPTLILMKKTGELINKNARSIVTNDPEGKDFPWIPKPVNPLNSMFASEINDCPSIIYYIKEGGDKETIKSALESVAKPHIDSNPEQRVYFYYHTAKEDEDDVGSGLRSFANMPGDHDIVLINVPEQEVYSTPADGPAAIKELWDSFVAKKLKMRPLRS